MENHHIPEEVIWNEYEAEKIAKSTIEKAIWEAEYIEYVHALAKQEAFNLKQDRDIQSFGEADICIKIAKWRAATLIERQKYEDLKKSTKVQLHDMLSKLKLENGFIIDPKAERRIIDLYNKPERIRGKFRSQILDLLLRVSEIIAQDEHE